jgi:hypothetical protein
MNLRALAEERRHAAEASALAAVRRAHRAAQARASVETMMAEARERGSILDRLAAQPESVQEEAALVFRSRIEPRLRRRFDEMVTRRGLCAALSRWFSASELHDVIDPIISGERRAVPIEGDV